MLVKPNCAEGDIPPASKSRRERVGEGSECEHRCRSRYHADCERSVDVIVISAGHKPQSYHKVTCRTASYHVSSIEPMGYQDLVGVCRPKSCLHDFALLFSISARTHIPISRPWALATNGMPRVPSQCPCTPRAVFRRVFSSMSESSVFQALTMVDSLSRRRCTPSP